MAFGGPIAITLENFSTTLMLDVAGFARIQQGSAGFSRFGNPLNLHWSFEIAGIAKAHGDVDSKWYLPNKS